MPAWQEQGSYAHQAQALGVEDFAEILHLLLLRQYTSFWDTANLEDVFCHDRAWICFRGMVGRTTSGVYALQLPGSPPKHALEHLQVQDVFQSIISLLP